MSAKNLKLYALLQTAAHKARKAADRSLMEASGVTAAQAALLAILEEEEVSQKRAAAVLDVNDSAITAMVQRLLAIGLVKRERDHRDGRMWKLSLTEKGHSALLGSRTKFEDINKVFDREISAKQLNELAMLLKRLADEFSAI